MNPLVSIIIPIYNVEKYIRHCILSVLSQDFDHSLVELILINDCTQDNSMEIVKNIIDKYQIENGGGMSIKILSHSKNRGLSASRNTGLSNASGEFVFFVDSDDYLFSGSIKNHLKYHNQYPEVDLNIGNYYDEQKAKNNYNISYPNKHSIAISQMKNVKSQFYAVCRKMLFFHLRNARLFLFLLCLFVFPPFNKLTRYGWFRHNCGKMITVSGKLEIGRDIFLNQIKSCKY